jgi:putative endonuclease
MRARLQKDTLRPILSWMEKATLRMRAKQTSAAQSNPTAHAGERGEDAAYFYLRRLGFTIVARRWRTGRMRGEVDLIAWEGDTLCFIEVKTRSRRDTVPAEYNIHGNKERTLRVMAAVYRCHLPRPRGHSTHPKNVEIRFDTVSVYLNELPHGIELVRDAFR